jgi:hypothetical protein
MAKAKTAKQKAASKRNLAKARAARHRSGLKSASSVGKFLGTGVVGGQRRLLYSGRAKGYVTASPRGFGLTESERKGGAYHQYKTSDVTGVKRRKKRLGKSK